MTIFPLRLDTLIRISHMVRVHVEYKTESRFDTCVCVFSSARVGTIGTRQVKRVLDGAREKNWVYQLSQKVNIK